MEAILYLLLAGSAYGWLYVVIVGIVGGIAARTSPAFRPSLLQWLALLLPAIVYYGLTFLVRDRQGFNVALVAPLLIAGVSLLVIIARIAQRPVLLSWAGVLGAIAAILLWWLFSAASNVMF